MPQVLLPDGKRLTFDAPVTAAHVAAEIGPRLAEAALAAKVNDQLVDMSFTITTDATLSVITAKSPEGLELIRHSTAHLLAHAVKRLFPTAQVTIGPVIENGFYYDVSYERSFTEQDLGTIEEEMRRITKENIPVVRKEMTREAAIEYFRSVNEHYKVQIIESIPENEVLSFYEQGNFIDLCRGPHVPSTGKLTTFKLMKLAGAYWRGDSKNEMLQRIYGTAWAEQKQLDEYLHRLEEAEKRDHRRIAKQLHLFHLQEEAPGMVFWHDRGWTIYQIMSQYIRYFQRKHNYQEIRTPQILDRSLWERSGHWDKFANDMFVTASENREYAIKPMNCPGHIQVFNNNLHSYKELPLRLAEFGACHRNEASGALHGLMRVRGFVQDDAHIFCTEDQIQSEVSSFIDLLFSVYKDFGFTEVTIKVSTRPENRVGSDEGWDKAEKGLMQALDSKGLAWQLNPGEGAFYGPKIEFHLHDCLGRVWQCGTMQIDFSMPERLGAHYIAEDSSRRVPVMLHRAIFGSVERFFAILVEHYAGAFPVWLAPVQAVVLTITGRQDEYVRSVEAKLDQMHIRVISDLRNEKIGLKIREHTLQRIPYLLIIGDREMETETVSVRTREGQDLGSMSIAQFVERLRADIPEHIRDVHFI